MEIKVIGSGCPTCTRLYKWLEELKKGGKIDADLKYSKDINELIELGVMGSPALVIDGKVASVGMPKSEEELLNIIKKNKE